MDIGLQHFVYNHTTYNHLNLDRRHLDVHNIIVEFKHKKIQAFMQILSHTLSREVKITHQCVCYNHFKNTKPVVKFNNSIVVIKWLS